MSPLLILLSIITFSIGNRVQIFFKKDIYVKISFYVISITALIFSALYFFEILESPYRNYLSK